MSGEDVYDLAADQWCRICDELHSPCEPADLRYECAACGKPIEESDEVDDGLLTWHPHCAPPRLAERGQV